MTDNETKTDTRRKPRWRVWLRRGFLVWSIFATTFLFSGYRTVDVDRRLLHSDPSVKVVEDAASLQFIPKTNAYDTALIFLCGSGVSAHAYAPMLRPIAERGFAVFIVKLPYRFAITESHRREAQCRAMKLIADDSGVKRWVVSGHSLGGALACRVARDNPEAIHGMILVGTTHPKRDDLSSVTFPVTKIYASNDGIAPRGKIQANMRLLPANTNYVVIDGGNHSQFGHYAGQFLDGAATITREHQQSATRTAILEMLAVSPSRR